MLRGGNRLDGLFYEPTLIEPTSNDAEIVQQEVFGPVLTLQTFASEEEAIALANSTEYGLAGLIYTSSLGRADRVGRAVRGGTIWVNTFLVRDLTAPFGGMGKSGIGREGGDYALDFYSDLKTLQILDGSVGVTIKEESTMSSTIQPPRAAARRTVPSPAASSCTAGSSAPRTSSSSSSPRPRRSPRWPAVRRRRTSSPATRASRSCSSRWRSSSASSPSATRR